MRADSLPRISTQVARTMLVALLALGFAGCKSEKDPDDPAVLGVPPKEAYLGVEYYYNFGAFGGDSVLNYSLSNAPSWLALEATSNKARQGIIMRGVPGLSGGNRGADDLGQTTGVNLLGTDGQRVGVQPFDIEVKENLLSLDASDDITEGEAGSAPQQSDDACEVPVVGRGSHTFEARVFDENGNPAAPEQRTRDTHAMLVTVNLDQPSVTPVTVAWEIRSRFDDTASCTDPGTDTPQECFYNGTNRSQAEIGVDVVGLGTGSEEYLPVPEDGALTYLDQDGDGQSTSGLLHFEPGTTQCYIRLEVIEDLIPESPENFQVVLTEVREGLASAGSDNDGTELGISIQDNEPRVRLETVNGGTLDVINAGSVPPDPDATPDPDAEPIRYPEYRAVLTGNRGNRTISAKIAPAPEPASNLQSADYGLEIREKEGDEWVWNPGDVVVFDQDTDEVLFRVVDMQGSPDEEQDQSLILLVSNEYAAGRVDYANKEAETDNLRLIVNELVTQLSVGDEAEFVATDVAIGSRGQILVAGYAPDGNDPETRTVEVRVYDRKGARVFFDTDKNPLVYLDDKGNDDDSDDETLAFEFGLGLAAGSEPVITFGSLSGIGSLEGFVISYGTEESLGSITNAGGVDSYAATFFFEDPDGVDEPRYGLIWETLNGTEGDDMPRSVAFGPSGGYVAIAGETGGQWPEQERSGAKDTYLQRINTVPVEEEDSDDVMASLAWTRQVGSGIDDQAVVALGQSDSPLLAGWGRGMVGESVGEEDYFFYSASDASSEITAYQGGTTAADRLVDAVYLSSRLWLLGNTTGNYQTRVIEAEEDGQPDVTELERETDGVSPAGFLVQYSTTGEFSGAVPLNDPDDSAAEQFEALLSFDGQLVAGGSSDGNFDGVDAGGAGDRLVLARVDPDSEAEEAVIWRTQSGESNTRIRAMDNNRDFEITTLVESETDGSKEWFIQLFSGEGRALNPLR